MTLPRNNVTLVKIYLYFRVVLAILLFAIFLYAPGDKILGTANARLFLFTINTYFGICLFAVGLISFARFAHTLKWVLTLLISDVLVILILIHASGGLESGLGYLLLVFVAIAGIFIRGQMGIAFAALTSLLVIGESIYLLQIDNGNNKDIFSAGTLGILIFATTYTFQILTEKIHTSTLEAVKQADYAQHLQRLAQTIVTRMRTGIMVVDDGGEIELINESALQLLDLPLDVDYKDVNINEIVALKSVVDSWLLNRVGGPPKVVELRAGQHARISLSTLDFGNSSRTVIYLEDHRVMTQQAQQLKLASLGRLTASIAHEIRNPLGAISHAAQLLEESPDIIPQDKRLTEIIQQHSKRVNGIVESTLALSRRKEAQPETIDLNLWLPRFVTQYQTGQQVKIDLEIESCAHLVKIDPTHLSQVLTNLLDNGLRYSKKVTGEAKVLVVVNQSRSDETHYIDVIDFGAGIAQDQLTHIFDPFYTTDEKGSGLGLYISRELCEINQATLHYRRTADNKSCFRIDFSHHQRMF